jgi:uncharacterized membrane protein
MVTSGILSGCISITILPTVYWNYVGTNPELLFKYLYPLLYIVTPIVVFYIGTKYMNNWDAFLSSCTFIFATNFFVTTANARTSVAMIFVVFMLWIIFTGSIEFYKKGLLFSICCIACVIAHYATAFLFFLIITFAITGYYILKNLHLLKNTLEKYFKIGYILIIGTFIFFWYGLINFQILNLQVNYIHIREQLINEIVVSPIPQNTVILYPILRIILLLRGVFYYFIIIGAIVLLLLLFQKSIFGDQNFKSNIFKKVPEIEYCIVVFICCFFLEITNYYPVAFIGYGVDRVGALIMLILPFIFIVGIKGITEIVLVGCNVFQKKVLKNENRPINFFINHLTSQKNIIIYSLILLIMIANLYCITGFGFQIAGEPNSLLFNSPEASQAYNYGSLYIHPQENSAITWMVRTIDRFDYNVFFDASSGGKVISRTTNTQIANSRTSLGNPHDYNYYFLSYPNVNYDDFSFNIGSQTNINEYTSLLKGQDLIYSNGGSQFLYRIR